MAQSSDISSRRRSLGFHSLSGGVPGLGRGYAGGICRCTKDRGAKSLGAGRRLCVPGNAVDGKCRTKRIHHGCSHRRDSRVARPATMAGGLPSWTSHLQAPVRHPISVCSHGRWKVAGHRCGNHHGSTSVGRNPDDVRARHLGRFPGFHGPVKAGRPHGRANGTLQDAVPVRCDTLDGWRRRVSVGRTDHHDVCDIGRCRLGLAQTNIA